MPWEYVILSFSGFALVMLVLIQFLRLKKHLDRIEILETNHLENETVLQPAPIPVQTSTAIK
jgi:hypothetical protein